MLAGADGRDELNGRLQARAPFEPSNRGNRRVSRRPHVSAFPSAYKFPGVCVPRRSFLSPLPSRLSDVARHGVHITRLRSCSALAICEYLSVCITLATVRIAVDDFMNLNEAGSMLTLVDVGLTILSSVETSLSSQRLERTY